MTSLVASVIEVFEIGAVRWLERRGLNPRRALLANAEIAALLVLAVVVIVWRHLR